MAPCVCKLSWLVEKIVMSIVFTKMSGSGNDFIIIDNRDPVIDHSKKNRFCLQKISKISRISGKNENIFENFQKFSKSFLIIIFFKVVGDKRESFYLVFPLICE